jgi:hypothetical protein
LLEGPTRVTGWRPPDILFSTNVIGFKHVGHRFESRK